MFWTQIQYQKAVYLHTIDLWLDPRMKREWAFVSHAHSDHIAAHTEAILTEATYQFMCLRKVVPQAVTLLPFGAPQRLRGMECTLWPSGHMLGGAQLVIAHEGRRLLYSGDFKLKKNWAAEAIIVPRAEILIMETTFGHRRHVFPPEEETVAQMAAWCDACLHEKVTPVLLGYAVGKSQEILAALAGRGYRFVLQDAVYQATRIAESLGASFPPYERWTPGTGADCVLICPPHLRRWAVDRLPAASRTAIVSGWAFDPAARSRFGANAAFCLSDHADYHDLLTYAAQVQAERIFTVHGYASEFAAELRRRGHDANALDEADQLALF